MRVAGVVLLLGSARRVGFVVFVSSRAPAAGVGVFRGTFPGTGHAGKRSPERDLRIGMFRGRPASLLLLFVRF